MRRRTRRGSRSTALSSQRGNFAGSMFRTRKLPYRQYKNKVYESLRFKEANRSIFDLCNSLTTAVLLATQKEWHNYIVPDNFYATAGGYIGTNTFDTDKFIIKGGKMRVMIRNTGDVPMAVEIMPILSKQNPHTAINGTVTLNHADISILAGFGSEFKLIGKVKKHILEPGDQCAFEYRIPMTIINDLTAWNSETMKPQIVWNTSTNVAGAHSYLFERGHNLTFCADSIA
jgi:hypothetical protein